MLVAERDQVVRVGGPKLAGAEIEDAVRAREQERVGVELVGAEHERGLGRRERDHRADARVAIWQSSAHIDGALPLVGILDLGGRAQSFARDLLRGPSRPRRSCRGASGPNSTTSQSRRSRTCRRRSALRSAKSSAFAEIGAQVVVRRVVVSGPVRPRQACRTRPPWRAPS